LAPYTGTPTFGHPRRPALYIGTAIVSDMPNEAVSRQCPESRASPDPRHGTPRKAPAVTREWPAEDPPEPFPWPDPAVAVPTLAAAVIALLASLGRPPVEVAFTTFLAGLLALVASLWATEGRRLPAAVALRGARRAVLRGRDAHDVARGLVGVRLRGGAAGCRDRAARCLVEAGKLGRMEDRLRREAVKWLSRALDVMFEDVR
jgi:hypothetical protein